MHTLCQCRYLACLDNLPLGGLYFWCRRCVALLPVKPNKFAESKVVIWATHTPEEVKTALALYGTAVIGVSYM